MPLRFFFSGSTRMRVGFSLEPLSGFQTRAVVLGWQYWKPIWEAKSHIGCFGSQHNI